MINKVYFKKYILKIRKALFMKSTDELLKILKNYNNIEEFIEDNTEDIKNTTFVQYITECLNNCNLTKAQVIEKSNIQKITPIRFLVVPKNLQEIRFLPFPFQWD